MPYGQNLYRRLHKQKGSSKYRRTPPVLYREQSSGDYRLRHLGRVQEELARRAGKRKVKQVGTKTEQGKYCGKYALTELLICGECGTPYRRCTWTVGGQKKIVWRCISRLDHGKRLPPITYNGRSVLTGCDHGNHSENGKSESRNTANTQNAHSNGIRL